MTSGSDCAAAAAMGGSQPVAARSIPRALHPAVNQRFCLIVRTARRPTCTAAGTALQSSAISATVRRLDGRVRPRHAHGDPDIGLGQSRRVVDPVAHHRDHAALALEPADQLDLLVGQDLGLALETQP